MTFYTSIMASVRTLALLAFSLCLDRQLVADTTTDSFVQGSCGKLTSSEKLVLFHTGFANEGQGSAYLKEEEIESFLNDQDPSLVNSGKYDAAKRALKAFKDRAIASINAPNVLKLNQLAEDRRQSHADSMDSPFFKSPNEWMEMGREENKCLFDWELAWKGETSPPKGCIENLSGNNEYYRKTLSDFPANSPPTLGRLFWTKHLEFAETILAEAKCYSTAKSTAAIKPCLTPLKAKEERVRSESSALYDRRLIAEHELSEENAARQLPALMARLSRCSMERVAFLNQQAVVRRPAQVNQSQKQGYSRDQTTGPNGLAL